MKLTLHLLLGALWYKAQPLNRASSGLQAARIAGAPDGKKRKKPNLATAKWYTPHGDIFLQEPENEVDKNPVQRNERVKGCSLVEFGGHGTDCTQMQV